MLCFVARENKNSDKREFPFSLLGCSVVWIFSHLIPFLLPVLSPFISTSFSCFILEFDNVPGCYLFSGMASRLVFGAVFQGHSHFRMELCCFVVHHSGLKDL